MGWGRWSFTCFASKQTEFPEAWVELMMLMGASALMATRRTGEMGVDSRGERGKCGFGYE